MYTIVMLSVSLVVVDIKMHKRKRQLPQRHRYAVKRQYGSQKVSLQSAHNNFASVLRLNSLVTPLNRFKQKGIVSIIHIVFIGKKRVVKVKKLLAALSIS